MTGNRFVHRVLVVDDDADMRMLVGLMLDGCCGVEVVGEAADGIAAFEAVGRLHPDVVLMDVEMPYLDGARATERIVEEFPSTRVVAFTGHVDPDAVTRMIVAGAVGYAVKGASAEELGATIRLAAARGAHVDREAMPALFNGIVELARSGRARRIEADRLNEQLTRTCGETVRALAIALRSHDEFTWEHDARVVVLAQAVARRLGLAEEEVRDVQYGAMFHDIGKLALPLELVAEGGELSLEEWEAARRHSLHGEQIIRPLGFLAGASVVVRHAYEHWDGSGFPDNLVGEEIPLASRIVLACGTWFSLVAPREAEQVPNEDAARETVVGLAGTRLDPRVVGALLDTLDDAGAVALDELGRAT